MSMFGLEISWASIQPHRTAWVSEWVSEMIQQRPFYITNCLLWRPHRRGRVRLNLSRSSSHQQRPPITTKDQHVRCRTHERPVDVQREPTTTLYAQPHPPRTICVNIESPTFDSSSMPTMKNRARLREGSVSLMPHRVACG